MNSAVSRLFDQSIEEDNGCWEWQGLRDKNGYGYINDNGRMRLTHRLSWNYHHSVELPSSIHVLHMCDNPICWNPEHLFLGNQQINMTDMRNKGRGQEGDTHGCRIINSDKAREVKRLIIAGERNIDISNKLGVPYRIVSQIKGGYSWRHVKVD